MHAHTHTHTHTHTHIHTLWVPAHNTSTYFIHINIHTHTHTPLLPTSPGHCACPPPKSGPLHKSSDPPPWLPSNHAINVNNNNNNEMMKVVASKNCLRSKQDDKQHTRTIPSRAHAQYHQDHRNRVLIQSNDHHTTQKHVHNRL